MVLVWAALFCRYHVCLLLSVLSSVQKNRNPQILLWTVSRRNFLCILVSASTSANRRRSAASWHHGSAEGGGHTTNVYILSCCHKQELLLTGRSALPPAQWCLAGVLAGKNIVPTWNRSRPGLWILWFLKKLHKVFICVANMRWVPFNSRKGQQSRRINSAPR